MHGDFSDGQRDAQASFALCVASLESAGLIWDSGSRSDVFLAVVSVRGFGCCFSRLLFEVVFMAGDCGALVGRVGWLYRI